MRAPTALLLCVGLVACDDPPADTTATATASASAAPKPVPTAEVVAPDPLDVDELKAALKCGGGGHGPCAVLDEFTECEKWSPVTQSGDGRWMGRGQIVKKGEFIEEFTLMRSKRVGLADVGPGQLPAKIGITNMPADRSSEIRTADAAIKAFERGDIPREVNTAVRFVKDKSDWPEAFSMQTKNEQVYVAVNGGAYICGKTSKQHLLLVRLSGDRAHKADGIYAKMYPVSW